MDVLHLGLNRTKKKRCAAYGYNVSIASIFFENLF